jgi:hypothetical protein
MPERPEDSRPRPTGLVLVAPASPRRAQPVVGPRAGAAFLSQLIAERMHLPPQRERRRETAEYATDSYASTARESVRRLPPGYRRTLIA